MDVPIVHCSPLFSNRPFALALIGLTAHVYVDTFSHFGFSGAEAKAGSGQVKLLISIEMMLKYGPILALEP